MRDASYKNLIESLKKEGLFFTESSMIHPGEYSYADADWNYKDIPHLNELHGLVNGVTTAIQDDLISTIFLQRVGPLRLPLSVTNYTADLNSQIYHTTCGPFCLIIQTAWEGTGTSQTRVTTTYSLGSSRFSIPFHKIGHLLLRNNYRNLMKVDVPMRKRRGALRSRGYSFSNDKNGYSFKTSLNLAVKNLVYPPSLMPSDWQLQLQDIPQGRTLLGSAEDQGLIVEREEESLSIFNRTCIHEGALLDKAMFQNGCLKCPWHGKRIKPDSVVDLSTIDNSILKVNVFGPVIKVSYGES